DDLNMSVAEVLKRLPAVVRVEVAVRADEPTHRIVHLRDFHFVPKSLSAVDMQDATGRKLSKDEIDRLHEELLLEVEVIQLDQMALLRCLIRHHGLKRIYAEGLTAKDLPNYKSKIAALRDMENQQITE